jgi:hypothetical protein
VTTESERPTFDRRAILVLGMHRSGTSAMTRMLSLRGAALPRRILSPASDNETGFWEPSEITAIHDQAFASARSPWHDISEFPRSWFASDTAQDFRQRLIAALREDYADAPLFVVKDPRLCRLVPLWLSVLRECEVEPLFVIPVRNPLEVAASLWKRDSYPEIKSRLLWLRYFLAAERDTRGLRRSFVAYSGLLEDWRGVADKIARDLDLRWPCHSAASDAEIDDFLSLEQRHHSNEPGELYVRQDIGNWLKTAFSWAMRAATDQPTAPEELDEIHAGLEAADRTFRPLIAAEEDRVAALSRDVARVTGVSTAREGEIQKLRAEVEAQGGQIARLQEGIATAGNKVDRLEGEIAARGDEARELHGKNRRLHAEIAARDGEITRRDGEIIQRDGALIRERYRIDRLQGEVAARTAEVAALRSSLSWRLTAPVRAIGTRIKRLRRAVASKS